MAEGAGWDGLPNHAVVLQDCSVPESHLIKENMSEADWSGFFSGPRLLVASMAAGLCRACLDEVARYAKQRVQCGRSLSGHQALSFRLADMATSLEITKAGVRSAALKLDAGWECLAEIDMLKLFATTHAEETASSAMEMAGGYGYTEDSRLSGLFRDAKGLQLYWGSRERMRMDIADAL